MFGLKFQLGQSSLNLLPSYELCDQSQNLPSGSCCYLVLLGSSASPHFLSMSFDSKFSLYYNIKAFMERQDLEKIRASDGRGQYARQLAQVKKSVNYRKLESVTNPGKGTKKIFTYHYAQDERWRLGSGSYGKVYCCYFEEVVTGRVHKFALKIIKVPSSIGDVKKIQDTVATTRQQIKSLIKLRQNPNIIKMEDVIGGDNNLIYLILEYCNNKDLQSFIHSQRSQGKLASEEQILFYFKQLLNGFQDLYKYNIIHRDIKPANIFVHNHILKIGDFGLSQQLFEKKENLHDHRTIGTFQTSAPQLIFKQPYTSKCDIYSLGLTLYWMLFEKFPFQHLDSFDKQQLMNYSVSFDHGTAIRPSPELSHLLKSMLAYKQDDRIDWKDLFEHPLFKHVKNVELGYEVRESIGRNLQGQNVSTIMQSIIPAEFYLYLGEQSDQSMPGLLDMSEKGTVQSFMKVFWEGVNFKFRTHFLKLLLGQVYKASHREKIKNKIEFSIMKDLLRLGIDSYIIYLNRRFLDELNGLNMLHLIDITVLNQLSCSKCFRSYVERFALEVEAYENSQKRPRLSEEQGHNLQRNCRQYAIADKFHLILSGQLLIKDKQEFLQQVKRCIVEMIYFVREEIRYYAHQEQNLPELQLARYRQLVLLVHHLNIFILQDKVFPRQYNSAINYDTDLFTKQELYHNKQAFFRLATQINEIIARFQN